MTGKYASWQTDSFNDDFLKAIANELAERNRLERYKINQGCYKHITRNKLEDEA